MTLPNHDTINLIRFISSFEMEVMKLLFFINSHLLLLIGVNINGWMEKSLQLRAKILRGPKCIGECALKMLASILVTWHDITSESVHVPTVFCELSSRSKGRVAVPLFFFPLTPKDFALKLQKAPVMASDVHSAQEQTMCISLFYNVFSSFDKGCLNYGLKIMGCHIKYFVRCWKIKYFMRC
jgi:hypothetical protein